MTSHAYFSHILKIRAIHRRQKNRMTLKNENDPLCSTKAELDEALTEEKSVVTIKKSELGRKTAFWIHFRKCVDGLILGISVGSIVCSSDTLSHDILKYGKPLALCGTLMHLGNWLAWRNNPLKDYKIVKGPTMCDLIKDDYKSSTVLVRRTESHPYILKTLTCAAAMVVAFWDDVKTLNFDEAFEKLKNLADEEKDAKKD